MTTPRTSRISTEYNEEMELINITTTPSSRDSSSASSMEGHASDAYAILLLHQQRLAESPLTTPTTYTSTTRGRSQSDSVTLSPSWTTLTPTSSSISQLPPPPKSFSSSCSRRSAPSIPALILPKTPPTVTSSNTISTISTTLLSHHHPSTPLTALSIGDASPGIVTPGLIQLRRSFPLPPSTHSHRLNEGVGEDIKTPTLSSSNMATEEPLYFTSYKLPGAFTSLDSLETVVPRSEEGDGEEQGRQQHSIPYVDTPSTPTHSSHDMQGTSSCSGVFSSPGCSSSSSYATPPFPHFKQGLSGKETMDADTNSPMNKSKRLKSKKSKASIRSDCSKEQHDVYLNDWISHDFSEATTPTHQSHETIYPRPSQSSLKQRQCDIEDKVISGQAAALGATTRSTSRSSWRSRYSSPLTQSNCKYVHESFEERRPGTAMSSFTTMTYHTISAETVYEDARDYQSGEEADLEDEDDHDEDEAVIHLPVSHCKFQPLGSCQELLSSWERSTSLYYHESSKDTDTLLFILVSVDSPFSITGLAISTSSSNSSISTITGAATSASPPLQGNEEKRNSNNNSSRFRLSFQRRRAMSPSDSQFSNSVFRPNSSLSLLSNQSSSQGSNTLSRGNMASASLGKIDGSMFARKDSTPRSSPENGHLSTQGNDANVNGIAPGNGKENEEGHSLMSLEHRRLSHLSSHGNQSHLYRQHRRAGSSISSCSSIDDASNMNNSNNASGNRERPLSSSLRPLMLTPEKTRRGSLKDWSISLYNQPATHGSAFNEELEELDSHPGTSAAPSNTNSCSRNQQDEEKSGKTENPYAEIYQELAKSPELEEFDDGVQSPLSPLCSPSEASSTISSTHSTSPAGLVVNALRVTHALEPVAEESFIDSDRDVSRDVLSPKAVEGGEASTSSNSVSVLAITTDGPPTVSAGRQSTESRRRRISKATSVNTAAISINKDINADDPRIRPSSTTSSAFSRPTTYTSASGNTVNSLDNATVEYGQRLSWQALNSERMQLKSPREERECDYHLKHFFQEEEDGLAQARQKMRAGSLPPIPDESSEQAGNDTRQQGLFARQRTKSQPAKLRHVVLSKDVEEQRYTDLVKELLPLDAGLRKQTKSTHRKVTKKTSKPVALSQDGTNGKKDDRQLSLFLLSALKKRKLANDPALSQGREGGSTRKATTQQVSPAWMKDKKIISAPIQARHICTGALNSIPNRESPFGRRPSSPVKGYIDVPFAESQTDSGGVIKHPLLIDFDDLASKDAGESASATASPVTNSASDRSSPSYQSQIGDSISMSPALFSSPLSSTSSHSEGPSTPRAFAPYIVSSISCTTNVERQSEHSTEGSTQSQPIDFWAVSFEEAQAGEGDFIAPHATLVKSGKLAMLSTNEKARRRASRASLRS